MVPVVKVGSRKDDDDRSLGERDRPSNLAHGWMDAWMDGWMDGMVVDCDGERRRE